MHVPWRRVASWHCSACGKCCRVYRPKLTAYEYLKLKPTGFVVEKAGRFYIRKIGKKCPFQVGRLCSLQNNLKPLSCKTFPFVIRKRGEEEALFEFDGEEFYVYADTFCPNLTIKRDTRPAITELVREAVMLFKGRGGLSRLTAAIPETAGPQLPPRRLAMV